MAGFADGFATGFGLVNDTYKRRAQEKLAETELEDRRAQQAGVLDFRNRQLDATNDEFDSNRAYEIKRLDALTAHQKRQDERQKKQDELDQQRLDAKDKKAAQDAAKNKVTIRRSNALLDAAEKKAQDDKERQDRMDALINGANAAQELMTLTDKLDVDNMSPDDLARASELMGGVTNSTAFDTATVTSPVSKYSDDAFRMELQKMQNGENVNEEVMTNAVQRVIGSSAKFAVGEVVTAETHPSAPKAHHGLRITGIDVRSLTLDSDENGQFVKPQVLVNLRDQNGNATAYIADMTQQRKGTSDPARLYVDKLLQGQAAQMNLTDYMKQNAEAFLEIQKRVQFTSEAGDYDARAYRKEFDRVNEVELRNIIDREIGSEPIVAGSSVTWDRFKKSDDWDSYVKHKVLYPNYSAEPSRNEADYIIATVREFPEVKSIEAERVKRNLNPLSERQVLEVATFFTQNRGGKAVIERSMRNDWNKHSLKLRGFKTRRGLFGQVQNDGGSAAPPKKNFLGGTTELTLKSDPSAFRSSGQRKSPQGWLGPVKNVQEGGIMTEVSIGVEINGEEIEIPAMVPTLTKDEINTLANMKLQGNAKNIPQSIKDKAIAHAKEQLSQGLSPFFDGGSAVPPKKNFLGGAVRMNEDRMSPRLYDPAKNYRTGSGISQDSQGNYYDGFGNLVAQNDAMAILAYENDGAPVYTNPNR